MITKKEKGISRKLYTTINPIIAITIQKNIIMVYEEGKYLPWKFNLNGELIEQAKVYEFTSFDKKYLEEDFSRYYKETKKKEDTSQKMKIYQNKTNY